LYRTTNNSNNEKKCSFIYLNIFDTLKYEDSLTKSGLYPLGYGPFQGPQPGDIYSIEVSAPGYDKVYAQTTIPEKVEILDVSIIPIGFIDELEKVWSAVTITFADPPEIENFYEIVVAYYGRFYESESHFNLFTHENIITGESYYPSPMEPHLKHPKHLIFNDRGFDGEVKTLSFYYYPPQVWDSLHYITDHLMSLQLRNITAEYYYHKTTLLQSLNNHVEDILGCIALEQGYQSHAVCKFYYCRHEIPLYH
jgi:hypothetical protein